jgi:hypothetical protein
MWTKKGQEDLDAITEKYMERPQLAAAKGVVPLLFISFPSAKDPLWPDKHPGKSTATIVTFANYDWFKEVRFLVNIEIKLCDDDGYTLWDLF